MDASQKRRFRFPFLIAIVSAVAVLALTALLVNIFQRQQEARNPFYRLVELSDDVEDPAIWGKNFPQQYDDYKRTVDQVRTGTAAARRCQKRRPNPIRARWSPNPASRRTRA